jgi:hypothetical protein
MSHIYVSIALFLISAACSLVVLTSKVEIWRKIFIVIGLCLSGLLSFRSMNILYGFPALLDSPIEETWIHAYHADSEGGWIYIWLRPDNGEIPISYKIPYSEKLHKKLESNAEASEGRPYKGSLDVVINPLRRQDETVEEVDVDMHLLYPLKNN